MSVHLFHCLSREEWKLCFALHFVESFGEYKGTYPLEDYATPGLEDEEGNIEEMFRRSVRFLSLAHGMEWEHLTRVDDSGSIEGFPGCPENELYRLLLANVKKLPDVPSMLRDAVTLAQERCPTLDTSPLSEALFEVSEALQAVEEATDPEELRKTEEAMDEALSTMGVVRIKEN